MMRPRKTTTQLEQTIEKANKKIVFLWGPRQTGKSTILTHLHNKYGGSYFNFDDLEDQRFFTPELHKLESAIAFKNQKSKSRYIFIDEVQNYSDSTRSIKLLADTGKYTIVATGSSELRAKTNQFDTLAGRYVEFILFPLTIDELARFNNEKINFVTKPTHAESQILSRYIEESMIFGSYPGVALSDNKIEELKNITQNSIVKDIVNIYELKNTDLVYNLLRVLAMQIGNLINVTELASALRSTKITIDNYLSILSKNRIIYLLEPFRTNARRAYLARKKIYFTDLGVRNTLIDDFRPIHLRQDLGAVFENLVIMGVFRQTHYQKNNHKLMYFREIGGRQKEVDLIIATSDGIKIGYEIKYRDGKINRFPQLNIAQYHSISKDNVAEFLV